MEKGGKEVIDMVLVLAVATMVSRMPYDSLRYNCWDYSTDLVAGLRADNITARIITGDVNCTSGLFDAASCEEFGGLHSWVSVGNAWIEATTGNVIADRSAYKMVRYSPPKYNPYKKGWVKSHE